MDGFVWTTVCCWQADYVEEYLLFMSEPMLRRAAIRFTYKLREAGAIDIDVVKDGFAPGTTRERISYKARQEIQP